MPKKEYISPEGLRLDGRRPHEPRRIRCSFGLFSKADGSAYLEQGNTKVLASVFGPHEVTQRSRMLADKAIITCEYTQATFATGGRRRPRNTNGRSRMADRKSVHAAQIVQQTFASALFVDLFPRSQIDINIMILQADGGTLSTAINAATLALIDAGIPMRDFVVSCTAGYIDNKALVDLNHMEIMAGGPELPVTYLPRMQKIVGVEMDSKVPMEVFEDVLDAGIAACKDVHMKLDNEVKKYATTLLERRGTSAY